jgi:hypothetical protein
LVRSFISNEKSIILAVCEASADISTSESVKLAKEVDPSGFRTLLVLTKLDRMDAGTDASSLLNGDIINIKLGIIGLVNNTELDNKKDKSLEQAEKDETSYTSKQCWQNGNKAPIFSCLFAFLPFSMPDCLFACLFAFLCRKCRKPRFQITPRHNLLGKSLNIIALLYLFQVSLSVNCLLDLIHS